MKLPYLIRLLGLLWLLAAPLALAGRACTSTAADAATLQSASVAAQRTYQALEAGSGRLALVARVGQDLSRFGLRYSHVGIALRDHPDGRWTVLHLLNECGTARSGVYAEGLLNFFLDGMVSYDSKIVWLQPELEAALLERIDGGWPQRLHDPRYNVIARWDSDDNQNSTGWVLALLGLALEPRASAVDDGVAAGAAAGFEPSVIRISYGKRVLGGLFSANADFTDHSVGDRLRGHYEVVTVRSIFEWLRRAGLAGDERVLGDSGSRAE